MILNLLLLLLSVVLFIFSPTEYNFYFNLFLTLFYIFHCYFFVLKRSKITLLNFHFIFITSYFFTNFFYPIFLYPIDPFFFSVFSYGLNSDYINQGTALSLVAMISYTFGCSILKLKKLSIDDSRILKDFKFINHFPFTIFSFLLFILFIITVGKEFIKGDFTAHSNISGYFLQLLISSILVAVVVFFKYYKNQKRRIIFYLLIFLYVILFLSIGDRGPALYLLVVILSIYSIFVKRIDVKYVFILGLSGIIVMHLIGVGRLVKTEFSDKNIISRGIEQSMVGDFSIMNMTESFVVNTRNLYLGIEHVDFNGYNYGETMLSSILGVLPFSQSLLENTTKIKLSTSADFFTNLTFGTSPPYGLGTNIVSDVYISFGLFGVIFMLVSLGLIIEFFRIKTLNNGSTKDTIIYFMFVSFSVYYVRAGIFLPFKFIIWALFIFYFVQGLKFFYKRKKYIDQKSLKEQTDLSEI